MPVIWETGLWIYIPQFSKGGINYIMDNTNYYSVLMDTLHSVEYDHFENIPELMKQDELYTARENCANCTTYRSVWSIW
jgi:hypothetical protein